MDMLRFGLPVGQDSDQPSGADMLVTGREGRSEISMEDFAIAIVDEAESRAHAGRSFAVGW